MVFNPGFDGDNFTVILDTVIDNATNDGGYLLSQYDNGANGLRFNFKLNGTARLIYYTPAGLKIATTPIIPELIDGLKHVIAIVWDSSVGWKIYIDGILKYSGNSGLGTITAPSNGNVYINSLPTGGSNKGQETCCILWSKTSYDQTEITDFYNWKIGA
jgi:hypothetical protein